MIYIAISTFSFIIILIFIFLYKKLYFYLIFFLFIIFTGVIYIIKYRDINSLIWFLARGDNYTQEISEKFNFQKDNLILFSLNKNINYQLKFDFHKPKSTEEDILEFEKTLEKIKNIKINIYHNCKYSKDHSYGNFYLYGQTNTSWSAGTVIYRDKSRNPFVTGFISENFTVPISLDTQNICFEFYINDEEVINYLNQGAIRISIQQKSQL